MYKRSSMKKFNTCCRNIGRFDNFTIEPCRQKNKQWSHLFAFASKYVVQDYIEQRDLTAHFSAEIGFKFSHFIFNRFLYTGESRHKYLFISNIIKSQAKDPLLI